MIQLPPFEQLQQGGKLAVSRVLTHLEVEADAPQTAVYLDKACQHVKGHVLGLTGPPGVGKSTLTDALIKYYRSHNLSVAVLAVDPSSQLTGGALLGDRTRLQADPEDQGVFIRSMAARDRLGGLSDHAMAAIVLLRAVMDRVIVESVGIGQSEGDLARACDTLVLCIQPGSGDSLQFMRAGVMELPDVISVTKADMGPAARRAASDVAGALSLMRVAGDVWPLPVIETSAKTGAGLDILAGAIEDHGEHLKRAGLFEVKRADQQIHWFFNMIRSRFGTAGTDFVRKLAPKDYATAPFSAYQSVARKIDALLFSGI